jgi:hypothetical protein
MRRLPILIVLLLVSTVLLTCQKAPQYDIVPAIKFVSVSKDTIQSGESITIDFTFQDGDGDLGTDATGDSSIDLCQTYSLDQFFDTACATYNGFDLFYLDSRQNSGLRCMKVSQVPVIPQKGTSKAISGDIEFQTFGLTAIPGRTIDSLKYYIVIKDNAGHCSNRIETNTVYILP